MKKLIIFSGLIFFMALGLISCYKDVILPEVAVDPDGPPQAVSFKNEIEPMVNSKCTLSGCHDKGGHKPWMVTGIAYKEIVNGGYVNTLVPKSSILYIMINGDMQPYIPSATDRQKIYDWIRNGAPNN